MYRKMYIVAFTQSKIRKKFIPRTLNVFLENKMWSYEV